MKTPTIKFCPCESSQLKEYGYDPASKTLAIRFKANDALYHYSDVPPEVFESLTKAKSFGRFFGEHLRGKYEYRRVDETTDNEASA